MHMFVCTFIFLNRKSWKTNRKTKIFGPLVHFLGKMYVGHGKFVLHIIKYYHRHCQVNLVERLMYSFFCLICISRIYLFNLHVVPNCPFLDDIFWRNLVKTFNEQIHYIRSIEIMSIIFDFHTHFWKNTNIWPRKYPLKTKFR